MTTVSQIITEAYRESNNIAIGQMPTDAEQQEGLLLFNRFLKSVFGNEAGDPLLPFSVGNNNIANSSYYNLPTIPGGWFAPRNSRVIFNNTTPQTLNLNPYPEDGERFAVNDASNNFSTYPVTLVGNGRLIDGATTAVLNTNGLVKEYFYRGDTSSWMSVLNLGPADTFPFPVEFEDLFVIGLAMRVNPRNKQDIDPQSVQAYRRLLTLFKARYSIKVDQRPEEALLRTKGIPSSYYRGPWPSLDPNQRFNIGYYY